MLTIIIIKRLKNAIDFPAVVDYNRDERKFILSPSPGRHASFDVTATPFAPKRAHGMTQVCRRPFFRISPGRRFCIPPGASVKNHQTLYPLL